MRTTEQFEFEIRKATRADIPQLVELGARFYKESNFIGGLEVSRENYKKTISKYIEGFYSVAGIVAVVDGQIVGYLHIYFQQDFTVERIGEVYQFYVTPEYRGTAVSRSLVESANLQYAEWNVSRGYVEASPGMEAGEHLKLFENLWGRFGYKKIGIVMMKEFKNGK
jgi:GNAT superfamily N-acetyltransferase